MEQISRLLERDPGKSDAGAAPEARDLDTGDEGEALLCKVCLSPITTESARIVVTPADSIAQALQRAPAGTTDIRRSCD